MQDAHVVPVVTAPDRCVTQSRYVVRLGHLTLDVRLWCNVCLVLGSDIRHPFIKGIGVETGVAWIVASGILMFFLEKEDVPPASAFGRCMQPYY